jgi:hypothetical protein
VTASPVRTASDTRSTIVCGWHAVPPVFLMPSIGQYRSMTLSTGRALLSACNVASRALYAAR